MFDHQYVKKYQDLQHEIHITKFIMKYTFILYNYFYLKQHTFIEIDGQNIVLETMSMSTITYIWS